MRRHRLTSGLALSTLAAAALACAPDAPVAPTAARAPETTPLLALDKSDFDADGDGRLDPAEKAAMERAEDAAKAAEKAAKAAADAAERAEKEQFERMKKDWKLYKDAVKKNRAEVEFVRCEPLPRAEARKTIGPKGGTLHVGPHALEIPKGALTEEVEITARTEMGSQREVEFQPHGLQFKAPVVLTMSYDRCIVPAWASVEVVYTDGGNRIVERHASSDDKALKAVEALTDHFSGYAVAYGRR
jgi:hypothetical protein